jgi:hypothetical protein
MVVWRPTDIGPPLKSILIQFRMPMSNGQPTRSGSQEANAQRLSVESKQHYQRVVVGLIIGRSYASSLLLTGVADIECRLEGGRLL